MNELEKVAQEEERRLEAFEKKKMGGKTLSLVTAKPGTGSSSQSQTRSPKCRSQATLTISSTWMVWTTKQKEMTREKQRGRRRERTLKGFWEDEDDVEAPWWKSTRLFGVCAQEKSQ